MPETIKLTWAWLGEQHSALPYLITTLSCLLGIDLWKKVHPKSWLWVISRAPFAEELTKAQELAHNFLVALPQTLGAGLFTWMASGGDLVAALLGAVAGASAPLTHHVRKAVASFLAKWRGPKDPPAGGNATKDPQPTRIRFDAPPEPPGGAAAIRRWVPACVYAVAFALALGAGSACSPSIWDSQQRTLNAVVVVTNGVLLPALERAHTRALTGAAQAQPDQESAALAVAVTSEKWAPVWQAYDAYVDAVRAWQVAIDTEGDVLSTGLAARSALCRLHTVARSLKAELPAPPAGTCP